MVGIKYNMKIVDVKPLTDHEGCYDPWLHDVRFCFLEAGFMHYLDGTYDAPDESDLKKVQSKWHTMNSCIIGTLVNSIGEVWSGPVPGHFFQTRDRTVWSLTKILGLGLGLPQTIYIDRSGPHPDPVQTQSLHILFIYLFKNKDSGLMWDGVASSSHQ